MSHIIVQKSNPQLIFKQINTQVDYDLPQLIERVYLYDC